jgi:acetoin utilization protein AcuB
MMRVRNWMKHPVRTVKPHETALHARAMLVEHRINQLPVAVDGKLVGIVTDRDLRDAFPSVFEAAAADAGVLEGDLSSPDTVRVDTVMTRDVSVTSPNEALADAARRMRAKRIGSLPVIDNGRLVGILTRSDLLDALVTMATDVEPVR